MSFNGTRAAGCGGGGALGQNQYSRSVHWGGGLWQQTPCLGVRIESAPALHEHYTGPRVTGLDAPSSMLGVHLLLPRSAVPARVG